MRSKLLNILLIVTSLLGYLEWGGGNEMFLFQMEAEIISKLFSDPRSMVHPFVLIPLLGQILLVITLFQKQPGKLLTLTGMGAIALLLLFMFAIGIMSLNFKVFFSTVPFVVTGVLTVMHYKRRRVSTNINT